MANPWDPLPLPRDADLDDKATCEGIGRIIDQWERIEFTLARMHSVFLGDPEGGPAMREYGAGRTLVERLGILKSQAEKWFAKKPNQRREGTFDRLMAEVLGFSDRRNEIAHGIVHAVSGLEVFRVRTTRADYLVQYAVIPAYHVMKRYKPGGVPKYMYATPEMQTLRDHLTVLYIELGDFLHEIDPI
jgi:hypothetical protein